MDAEPPPRAGPQRRCVRRVSLPDGPAELGYAHERGRGCRMETTTVTPPPPPYPATATSRRRPRRHGRLNVW